jgi:hypothetical protein
MAETQKQNPEANIAHIKDLYNQCFNVLVAFGDRGHIEPSHLPYMLKESVDVPALNGRRLQIEWERPNREDDPTAIDYSVPIEHYDESGKNLWHTPMTIRVYSEADGSELHNYDIASAGATVESEPTSGYAYDSHFMPGQGPEDYPAMTALEANELIAHLEWALEADPSHPATPYN